MEGVIQFNNLVLEQSMSSLNSPVSPTNSALVLIAEDETEIADILIAYLQRSGLRTQHAADGQQALAMHQAHKPDLLLLDVQMPHMDGWNVLNEIRAHSDTPVIMLTALDQDIDKLMGLRLGADDYVVKPFNPAEVVARVQAVLRRVQSSTPATTKMLRVGKFQIDLDNHEASIYCNEQQLTLDLTLTEFKLLACLMRSPKRAFSREELLINCLPEGDSQERTVDSHISKLRKKLEALDIHGVPASVWGVGYRFGGET